MLMYSFHYIYNIDAYLTYIHAYNIHQYVDVRAETTVTIMQGNRMQ